MLAASSRHSGGWRKKCVVSSHLFPPRGKELPKAAQMSFVLSKITKENILVGCMCLSRFHGTVEIRVLEL
jgi:hypothetical protein